MDFTVFTSRGMTYGVGDDPNKSVMLIVDTRDTPGRVFKRNAMHMGKGTTRWLVGELDGVRLYRLEDGTLLMTKCDLYASRNEDIVAQLADGAFDG